MIFQRMRRPILLGIKSLKLHKLRSFLTILGVVFGVASVIVMLAIGEGARREAIQAINELGSTNIILRSVKPSDLASDVNSGGAVRYGLTIRDMQRIQISVPSIQVAAPTREHRREIRYENNHLDGRVVGVTPDYQDLNKLQVEQGRFIEAIDCERAAKVVVLGAETGAVLFPITNPLGKIIRIGEDQYYYVVGVIKPRAASPGMGDSLPAQDHNRDIYIPFTADQKRFGETIVFDRTGSRPPEKVEVSQITLSVQDTQSVRPTARVIADVVAAVAKEDEVSMTVPLDLLEKAEETQRIFTWVLTAIASISLLVGGIGIMNIMLATVTERTREIGIRRALGARRADIVWQFLIETTVLSGTGGLIGIGLGIGGALLASKIAGVSTLVEPWSPILAFGISVCVGLVFGLYPARRAAHLDPIQALRHD